MKHMRARQSIDRSVSWSTGRGTVVLRIAREFMKETKYVFCFSRINYRAVFVSREGRRRHQDPFSNRYSFVLFSSQPAIESGPFIDELLLMETWSIKTETMAIWIVFVAFSISNEWPQFKSHTWLDDLAVFVIVCLLSAIFGVNPIE